MSMSKTACQCRRRHSRGSLGLSLTGAVGDGLQHRRDHQRDQKVDHLVTATLARTQHVTNVLCRLTQLVDAARAVPGPRADMGITSLMTTQETGLAITGNGLDQLDFESR
jgi:hypothetical protein